MKLSVRAYRTLLWLYPRAFREEYGDDMVLLAQDMSRDTNSGRVWLTLARDAAVSIPLQRIEALMSARPSVRFAPLLSLLVLCAAMLVVAAAGTTPFLVVVPAVVCAVAVAAAALLYWRSNRGYVEPADAMYRHWLRFIAGGAAILLSIVVGASATDLALNWMVGMGIVFVGVGCMAFGCGLGVWNGFAALRHRGDNGAWPAS
jgi:hypothetical protein